MYNARLEQSTPTQRVLRTTTKAMYDGMRKEDAAKRRKVQAAGKGLREQLKAAGSIL